MGNYMNCPICGEEAVSRCKCFRSDSVCKNGHKWHKCSIHKNVVIGFSDHSLPITKCTCKKDNNG
jgi:hypothetical protein